MHRLLHRPITTDLWVQLRRSAAAALAALGLALGSSPVAHADETLARILQTRRVVLGVHDASMPLSYMDDAGQYMGYHMDVCMRLVRAIQSKLELPSLKVVTVPTTMASRVALLDNGTIDIECAHNPITASSLSRALFSHATMVSDLQLMTSIDNDALTLQTLGGRTIGQVGGGMAVGALRMLGRKAGFAYKQAYARTAPELFGLLADGRVDAIVMPAPYALAERARAAQPERYKLVPGVLASDPIGLMFRLGDEQLHALANEVLEALMSSGEMERLYDKWFMQAIPGLPVPLGYPLQARVRSWFQAPGSEMKDL